MRERHDTGALRERISIDEINVDRLDCRNCNRFDVAKGFVAGLL